MSGPARPTAARTGAAALPLPRRVPLPRPSFGGLPGHAAEALCRLRDSSVVDRLARGQGWIALLGVLLIGLVALNVSLLKLNAQNGRNAEVTRDLRITNAKLRGTVSRLGSSDRLQAAAERMGLVMPSPQAIAYLTAHPASDPRRAAKKVRLGLPLPDGVELVSSDPEAAAEVAAPTPSQPIVPEAQTAPVGTTGTSGATGTATPTGATAPPSTTTPAPGPTGAAGTTGTTGGQAATPPAQTTPGTATTP